MRIHIKNLIANMVGVGEQRGSAGKKKGSVGKGLVTGLMAARGREMFNNETIPRLGLEKEGGPGA